MSVLQKWRTSTASSVYSVRQSEEMITLLRKENFNLKLKMFLIECQKGESAVKPEMDDLCDREFVDLVMENQMIKNDFNNNQQLLKEALKIIERLEEENLRSQMKIKALSSDQKTKATKSMAKLPMIKRRKSKSSVPSTSGENIADSITLRTENRELRSKLRELEEELLDRNLSSQDYSNELEILQNQLMLKDSKLAENKVELAKLTETLEKQNLLISGLTEKLKLQENESSDMKRILIEQTALMKALNRTIEAKNQEFTEFKSQIDRKSSTSIDIHFPEELDLTRLREMKLLPGASDFPFYNPLFGSQFESLYR